MIPKIRIHRSGKLICETEGVLGESLYSVINSAGTYIDAPCGGAGRCSKCLVRTAPGGDEILACRTLVGGDMDVYLPEEAEMSISEAGATGAGASSVYAPPGALPSPAIGGYENAAAPDPHTGRKFGVAADIGTTTVVVHLTNIATGKRVATASGANAQRPYGADVISRIRYCAENGHETLSNLIRDQLSTLIRHTCEVSGEHARDIGYVSIAGNTVMEHLVAGYSPVGMGTAPFTPVDLFGEEIGAWEGLHASKTAKVFLCPAISSYFGGDAIAGMLAAGLPDDEGPTIFLDIGTNGELAMKYGDKFYCCSTAAGPAFEGAEIAMGMAAVSGAIDHVKWDGKLQVTVIGNQAPRGICGSGLLDALAVMVEKGAVDETGRLLDADEAGRDVAPHIGKVDGKNVFWLTMGSGGIYISALDVRKLQLAKSAIAAGIRTLIHHAGIGEDRVKSFILAGGFGSYMDKHSAAGIGMFPHSFLPKTLTLGNTAGEGAVLSLCSGSSRDALMDICKHCEYIDLAGNEVFRDQFTEQMFF